MKNIHFTKEDFKFIERQASKVWEKTFVYYADNKDKNDDFLIIKEPYDRCSNAVHEEIFHAVGACIIEILRNHGFDS
jgi:hypothetical protein